jgi:hypothetical protein
MNQTTKINKGTTTFIFLLVEEFLNPKNNLPRCSPTISASSNE